MGHRSVARTELLRDCWLLYLKSDNIEGGPQLILGISAAAPHFSIQSEDGQLIRATKRTNEYGARIRTQFGVRSGADAIFSDFCVAVGLISHGTSWADPPSRFEIDRPLLQSILITNDERT